MISFFLISQKLEEILSRASTGFAITRAKLSAMPAALWPCRRMSVPPAAMGRGAKL